MLVLKNKHNRETLQTEAPSPFYSISYNLAKDDIKSVVGDYDTGIIPETNRGCFEHHIHGEDAGGGLWFDEDGNLEDYDGVQILPEDVVKGIRELLRKVPDTICVDGFWNDTKEEFSYSAVIGESEKIDDEDIFYQFDSADEVIGDHGDFTITSFSRLL